MKSKINYFVDNAVLYASGQWPITKIGALRESIQKWKFISKHPGIRHGAGDSCACCHLAGSKCEGCLISEAGHPNCLDTPYVKYSDNPTAENAREEVRFLQRILKANSPKAKIKGK